MATIQCPHCGHIAGERDVWKIETVKSATLHDHRAECGGCGERFSYFVRE